MTSIIIDIIDVLDTSDQRLSGNVFQSHAMQRVSGIFRVTLFAWPYPLGIIRVGIFRVRNFPRQTYQLDCSKAVKCKGLN